MVRCSKCINMFFVLAIIFSSLSCKKAEAPSDAPAIETKITGKVTDGKTNQPIAGANITTSPVTSAVNTGSDGSYTIPNVSAGQYTILASKADYNDATSTVNIQEGKTVIADITLLPIGPELEVIPTSLNFDIAQNSLVVSIKNKSQKGTVTWAASSIHTWMSISPNAGTTTSETDQMTITVDRSNVAFGNYTGVVSITSDYGSKDVNVQMIKQNPNEPQLSVYPLVFDFGGTQSTDNLLIKNTGTGTLNWNINKSDGWITVNSTSGSLSANMTSTVQVGVTRNNLAVGNFTGTITVSGANTNIASQVKMQVLSTTISAPTLSVASKTASNISLEWTRVTAVNFAKYKIYRSTSPGVTENSQLIADISNANTTTYEDNSVTGGTTYYYRIFVYNTENLANGSSEVQATTDIPVKAWVLQTEIANITSFDIVKANSDNDAYAFGVSSTTSKAVIAHWDGTDWTTKQYSDYYKFTDVKFINASKGYALANAVTNEYVLLEFNGLSWSKISTIVTSFSNNYSPQMTVIADNNIYVVEGGASNKIYRYNGSTWSSVSVGSHAFYSIFSFSASDVWANNSYREYYRFNGTGWSLDANASSASYSANYNYNFYCLFPLNANNVWEGYQDNYYQMVDMYNGSKWQEKQKVYYVNDIFGIFMISSTYGWFVGKNGVINKYSGGTSLENVNSPTTKTLYSVFMLNATSGWAVGSGGVILKY